MIICRLTNEFILDKIDSHIISLFLFNDLLSEDEGNHRDDGIIFRVNSYNTHFEIGRSRLPENIEEDFGYSSDTAIKNQSELTTEPYIFSKKAEEKFNQIESSGSSLIKKIKNSSGGKIIFKQSEIETLKKLMLIQLFRAGVVNFQGFSLPENILEELRKFLNGEIEKFDYFQMHIFKLDKRSKTSGMITLKSENGTYSILIDDLVFMFVVPGIFDHKGLPSSFFYGFGGILSKLNNLEFINFVDSKSSFNFYDNINLEIAKQRIHNLEDIALKILRFRYPWLSLDRINIKPWIAEVFAKFEKLSILNRNQFAYLFCISNKLFNRNPLIEAQLFGKSIF